MSPTLDASAELEILDHQHEEIDAAREALRVAIVNGQGLAAMQKASRRLIEVTLDHFESEEAYLEHIGFTNREAHRNEHQKFVSELRAVERQLEERRIRAPLVLLRLFESWLKHHLEHEDSVYQKRGCWNSQ